MNVLCIIFTWNMQSPVIRQIWVLFYNLIWKVASLCSVFSFLYVGFFFSHPSTRSWSCWWLSFLHMSVSLQDEELTQTGSLNCLFLNSWHQANTQRLWDERRKQNERRENLETQRRNLISAGAMSSPGLKGKPEKLLLFHCLESLRLCWVPLIPPTVIGTIF